jgi:hypothetical protein
MDEKKLNRGEFHNNFLSFGHPNKLKFGEKLIYQ